MEKFNEEMRSLFDAMQLSIRDCDQIISAINRRLLVEGGNRPAKHLRSALCLAIEIIRWENLLQQFANNDGQN